MSNNFKKAYRQILFCILTTIIAVISIVYLYPLDNPVKYFATIIILLIITMHWFVTRENMRKIFLKDNKVTEGQIQSVSRKEVIIRGEKSYIYYISLKNQGRFYINNLPKKEEYFNDRATLRNSFAKVQYIDSPNGKETTKIQINLD